MTDGRQDLRRLPTVPLPTTCCNCAHKKDAGSQKTAQCAHTHRHTHTATLTATAPSSITARDTPSQARFAAQSLFCTPPNCRLSPATTLPTALTLGTARRRRRPQRQRQQPFEQLVRAQLHRSRLRRRTPGIRSWQRRRPRARLRSPPHLTTKNTTQGACAAAAAAPPQRTHAHRAGCSAALPWPAPAPRRCRWHAAPVTAALQRRQHALPRAAVAVQQVRSCGRLCGCPQAAIRSLLHVLWAQVGAHPPCVDARSVLRALY